MSDTEYAHLLRKCREAKMMNDYHVLSTGERLAAAIVLNKPHWLQEQGYTLAEAFDRIGPTWWPLLLRAQRDISDGVE
jgi:hypothetical protein